MRRNRQPDRWKDGKQLATKVAEDDPLLVFLKRINGNVMRPVEHKPAAIEAECQYVTPERQGTNAEGLRSMALEPRLTSLEVAKLLRYTICEPLHPLDL